MIIMTAQELQKITKHDEREFADADPEHDRYGCQKLREGERVTRKAYTDRDYFPY
jgi:hypothetical protein